MCHSVFVFVLILNFCPWKCWGQYISNEISTYRGNLPSFYTFSLSQNIDTTIP